MKLKVIHTPIYNINLLALSQRGKVSNSLTRTFMFTEESKYTTKNPEDQEDWNKLTGIASLPFNSQKSSHMWAWRYYNNEFQIAPYSHRPNGDIVFPHTDNIRIIPQDLKFSVEIIIDGKRIIFYSWINDLNSTKQWFESTKQWFESSYLLPKDSYRIITSWFGGTSLPKKIVKIYGI